MPSRKQRRRRQKEKRHEYEYVFVDEHGREVDVEERPVASPNGTRARAKERATPTAPRSRTGRTVEPASWRRAGRRGLLFAPLMFGVLYLLNRDMPPVALALNTIILLAFFVPFGYFMDKMMYRAFVRRTTTSQEGKKRR